MPDGTGGNLFTIRPDGTDLRQLTHFKPGFTLGEAAFSPDGDWIAFTRGTGSAGRDVFVMRSDGSHLRQTT